MNILFFGRQYQERKKQITALDKEATQIHEENVKSIAFASRKVDNLKQVLEDNGITIKIQKATGHKHDNRNFQSAL